MGKDSGIYKLTEHSLYIMLDVLFNKIKEIGYYPQIYETDFINSTLTFYVDKNVENDLRKFLYDNVPGVTNLKTNDPGGHQVHMEFGFSSVYFYMNNVLIMK